MSSPTNRTSLAPPTWNIPEVFRRRLGTRVGRQRMMEADGHLLLVLHAPPRPDDDERQGRFYWMNPDGEWKSTEQGGGLASLERHVDEYSERIEELDQRVDAAIRSEEYFRALNELTPLLRAARNLHRTLQDARKAFPDRLELIDVRDRCYAMARSAELSYADATNSLQYTVALQSERQSQAAHQMSVAAYRLNILAAIFFPIATLSAVFGVNLKHTWEEAAAPWPFVALSCVGLLMGIVLVFFMLRPAAPAPDSPKPSQSSRP